MDARSFFSAPIHPNHNHNHNHNQNHIQPIQNQHASTSTSSYLQTNLSSDQPWDLHPNVTPQSPSPPHLAPIPSRPTSAGKAPSYSHKSKPTGGRPLDKIWNYYTGDRETGAVCKFCDFVLANPRAFRLRRHSSTCSNISSQARAEVQKLEEFAKASAFKSPKRVRGSDKEEEETTVPVKDKKARGPRKKKPEQRDLLPTISLVAMPFKRSPITCHVLDSTNGKPAAEVQVRLDSLSASGFEMMAQGITDPDGRCSSLLPSTTEIAPGVYKITFFTSQYFTNRGIKSFYPFVEVPFEVRSTDEHYHIPLLLSPYAYSTYRGS